jgi:hypothetical protein
MSDHRRCFERDDLHVPQRQVNVRRAWPPFEQAMSPNTAPVFFVKVTVSEAP